MEPPCSQELTLDCAGCDRPLCRGGEDCYDAADLVRKRYAESGPEAARLSKVAASVEADGYLRWPRAEEIIEFARRAGFTHLGLAFCIGLHSEAREYARILKRQFRVSSVCCKVCGLDKAAMGLPPLRPEATRETMCAPIGQAELLNRANVELNILVGLCVGHDALFSQHATAPVTTLITKDRVLAHNPAGALYSGYWRKRLGREPTP